MTDQAISKIFELSGKGAIVTGAGMGIGRMTAVRLSEAGAKVIVADIDFEAANQTVEQIKAKGGEARAIHADVGNTAEAKKVIQATVDAFGGPDILVNNAGVCPFSPVLETTEETWDKVFDINLKGLFFLSQAAAREMVRKGISGKIINISSRDGLRPLTGNLAAYSASKAGVVMITQAMAKELGPYRIQVNAIAPGSIETPMLRSFVAGSNNPEELIRKNVETIPIRRMGQPDDIAKAVLFLASSAADFMTGSLLLVDGGSLL